MKRLLLSTLLLAAPLAAQESSWGIFFEQLEIDRLVLRWSAAAKPATAAFIGVELIAMTENPAVIRHDQTVIVRDGKIEYSELSAFLSAANREVTDPRARLAVVVHPPAMAFKTEFQSAP